MLRIAVRPVEPITRRSGRGDQLTADDAFARSIAGGAPKKTFAAILDAILARGRRSVVKRARRLRTTREELASLLNRLRES